MWMELWRLFYVWLPCLTHRLNSYNVWVHDTSILGFFHIQLSGLSVSENCDSALWVGPYSRLMLHYAHL